MLARINGQWLWTGCCYEDTMRRDIYDDMSDELCLFLQQVGDSLRGM